jgi:hypothetical protein
MILQESLFQFISEKNKTEKQETRIKRIEPRAKTKKSWKLEVGSAKVEM